MAKKKPTPKKPRSKRSTPKSPPPNLPYIPRQLRNLACPIEDLTPDPENARLHPEESVTALMASFKVNGFNGVILVNSNTGLIVNGHNRYEAAKRLGWTHVPVISKPLTRAQARACAIADNVTADLSVWDEVKFQEQIATILDDTPDLAADLRLEDLLTAAEEEAAEVTEGPEPQLDRADELQQQWGTEPGQLWEIDGQAGTHRLLCGDCRDSEDMRRLCSDNVSGCFTSPPYAEQRSDQYGGVPAGEYVEWWGSVQENVRGVLADDGSFFVNIKPHCEAGERVLYVFDLVVAMKRRWGWAYNDEYCWLRTGVPKLVKHRFKNAFEPIYHFAVAPKAFKFRPNAVTHESDNVPQARGAGAGNTNWAGQQGKTAAQRQATDQRGADHLFGQQKVVTGQAFPSNVLKAFQPAEALGHPAAFGVGLVEFFVKAYSDPGDCWLDPFLGSGTTMVAAEQLGRICYGIEIEPKYVAVILQRLADMGRKPKLKKKK